METAAQRSSGAVKADTPFQPGENQKASKGSGEKGVLLLDVDLTEGRSKSLEMISGAFYHVGAWTEAGERWFLIQTQGLSYHWGYRGHVLSSFVLKSVGLNIFKCSWPSITSSQTFFKGHQNLTKQFQLKVQSFQQDHYQSLLSNHGDGFVDMQVSVKLAVLWFLVHVSFTVIVLKHGSFVRTSEMGVWQNKSSKQTLDNVQKAPQKIVGGPLPNDHVQDHDPQRSLHFWD